MFLGLREHKVRSNPCIIGVKITFDPNIIPMENTSGAPENRNRRQK